MRRTSNVILTVVLAGALVVIIGSTFSIIERLIDNTTTLVTPERVSLEFNGSRVSVEVASTPSQQELGLSYRESLAPDAGMLFSFDVPARPAFWMKGMNFPLDFIYMRRGIVVELKESVPNAIIPAPFFSNEEVDAVLEVNAGWVKAHGVKVGDMVGYPI